MKTKEKGNHAKQYCDSLETPDLKHDTMKIVNLIIKHHERILHNINPGGDCKDMSFKEL